MRPAPPPPNLPTGTIDNDHRPGLRHRIARHRPPTPHTSRQGPSTMTTAQAYVTDSIATAGPAQLVLALYDGALGAIERARSLLVLGAHEGRSDIWEIDS